ncbi:MAG TPA: CRISPR-associated endoribonuclease Cas6 [Bacillota bacterium]|nr:CRISPR-associated endoribonuclease Cas6 [Bacillota bacterium]
MRVQLTFKMTSIPLQYRIGMLSVIKEMIKTGSPIYYEQLFIQNKKKMKNFSYATYITKLDIQNEHIQGEELHLTITSPSYEFVMHLLNGSKRESVYYIKGSKLILKRKRLLPKTAIEEDLITFKTLSPILLESKEGKPVLATDENFKTEFQYLAHLILKEVFMREPRRPIQVLQTMMERQVLKEDLHQVQKNPLYLTANKGFIQLQGEPEDLQALYDAGVSMRRSLGLGLLEMAKGV